MNAKMIIAVDDPSPSLTSLSGYIQVTEDQRVETNPLDLNNVLLRVS